MLCLPISRTILQWVGQSQSLSVVSRNNVLGVIVLHIDLLIPGVAKIPAVDVGFGVALVLPNRVPSSEDSSGHILW
jgi:hypothetical protein